MILSIITLNYKKSHLTIICMRSLYEQFKKEFEENMMELIIVDNASGDNSVSALRDEMKNKKYKNMHLIANDKNDGFGKGCNLGAASAKGRHYLFLNNDTIVKDRGILKMANYLDEHKEVALLGGQLRNFNGSKQPSVGKFYTLFNVLMLLLGMQKFGFFDRSPSSIERVDWIKGGLFMIRSVVFKKLHGFDEAIFMYTEDMELCYRAKLAGYIVYFYPDVKILHAEQGSSNRTFAIVNIYQNLLYFYKKHRSPGEYLFLKTLLKSKAFILSTVGRITNNTYLTQTYEKALKVT